VPVVSIFFLSVSPADEKPCALIDWLMLFLLSCKIDSLQDATLVNA
jgi:hypothetical protein